MWSLGHLIVFPYWHCFQQSVELKSNCFTAGALVKPWMEYKCSSSRQIPESLLPFYQWSWCKKCFLNQFSHTRNKGNVQSANHLQQGEVILWLDSDQVNSFHIYFLHFWYPFNWNPFKLPYHSQHFYKVSKWRGGCTGYKLHSETQSNVTLV